MSSNSRTDTIGTRDIVSHLWSRRHGLLLVPAVCVIVVFAYVKLRFADQFQSKALVMVRTAPGTLRESAPKFLDLQPPVYQDFFLNDELLFDVVSTVREEFPSWLAKFEDVKPAFQIKTVLTRETVVSAEYSPVIELSVTIEGNDITYRLAQVWLDKSIERFGSVRSNEAREITESLGNTLDDLGKDIDRLALEQAQLERQIDNFDEIIKAKHAVLGGKDAVVFVTPQYPQDKVRPADTGLFNERVQLELELAEVEKSEAAAERQAAQRLVARMGKVDEIISRVLGEIEVLGKQKVNLVRQLDVVREQLLSTRAQLDQTRNSLAGATPDSASLADPFNPENSGELSVLARPVQAEKKVGPPRALISIAFGLALGVFLLLLVLMELYVRKMVYER